MSDITEDGHSGCKPATRWVDEMEWGRALDPSLPPGVIALQDGGGCWWRYPLAEFDVPGDCAEWTP